MTPFGSLFSGCGGMDSGLEDAGLRCAWQVEIDPKRRDVLRYHWPEIPRYGDIKEICTDELPPVRLIAGGSPCQDLSVAGLRQGLDGERSGLFYEFVRIADSQPSAWVLWENVDGALSSNGGGDFGIVLREFTGFWPSAPADGWRSSGFCVGPKRWAVWRVLDSEYFGVPQRRYRIFLVGGPRGGACAPEILLEPDCLPRNPPPSRQSGAGVAGTLMSGAGERGWRVGADEAAAGHIVSALTRNGVGASGPDDNQAQAGHLVAHTLRGVGFDASEDGTGRGTPLVIARCLTARGGSGRSDFESETFIPVPYHLAQITHGENRANPKPGDPSPALNGDPRLAIAYQCHGGNVGPIGTIRKHGSVAGVPFVASTPKAHHQPSYDAAGEGPGPVNMIPGPSGVRRLTPRECERLQAYPDDWTRYGRRENGDIYELKDSPRYAMVGDGVTRSVAAWIGRRIMDNIQTLSK